MSQDLNEQAQELNDIINRVSPNIFSLLSEKGKNIYFPKKGILSQGKEAAKMGINATVGQAFEDDGTPMFIKSIQEEISLPPKEVFTYSPSYGRADLRQKWQELLRTKNPTLANKNISLPVVCSALTHGLSICGYMFVNPGDKILIPDLYWENYDLIFGNAYGAKIVNYKLFKNDRLDLDSLEASLCDGEVGKKIVLLNFPNNPTGYTPTKTEATGIADIIKKAADKGNNILVMIDDAYFGLEYEEDIIEESLFAYLADIHQNVLTVKLDGPTKEDYVWGFRVGFITLATKKATAEFYNAFESKIAGAIRGNISNCSTPSQTLLYRAYSSATYHQEKDEKYNTLKARYNMIKKTIAAKPEYKEYFEPLPYNSGYFMCIKLNGIDTEVLRRELIEHYDTGVIAMSGVIRIAFSAVKSELIPKLFDNIYQAAKAIKNA
ncbi:MAG: aminotransferase class I/II-fold pyridoxal phosphate-dependent enzyme [Spirochaetales bacterium]|nr:aminotransferase class I/II-fold pyridoxal phosphate-dependent enzyme [Spirochaetales bacterium]